jgi:hypothetical protein
VSRRLTLSLFAAPLLAVCAAAALAWPAPAAAKVFGGVDRGEPLARFQDPVCPGIVGLKVDFAEMMVGRIRDNAAALGLPLGDPATCEPNLLVLVLADGRGYLGELRQQRGYLFDEMDAGDRQALFEAPGQVRSWTRVVTKTRDGLHVDRRDNLVDLPHATMWAAQSLISVPTRRDIVSAMVLIDREAIGSLSVVQLGDYVTMRAFGGDALGELAPPPGGSILTLFDGGGARPGVLTRVDRTFLQTLYGSQPNLPAALTLARAQSLIESGR